MKKTNNIGERWWGGGGGGAEGVLMERVKG